MRVEVGGRLGGREQGPGDDGMRWGEVVSDVRREDVCARSFNGRARLLRPRRAHCAFLASVFNLPSAPASHAGRTSKPRRASSGTMVGVRAPAARRCGPRTPEMSASGRHISGEHERLAQRRRSGCAQLRDLSASANRGHYEGRTRTGRREGSGGGRVVHGRDGAVLRGARSSNVAWEVEAVLLQEGASRLTR
jgi:hypothetical protein